MKWIISGCIHFEGFYLQNFFSFQFDLLQLVILLNGSTGTRLLCVFSTRLFDSRPVIFIQPIQIVLLSLLKNITLFSLVYIGGYSVAAAMNCAGETNDFFSFFNQVLFSGLSLKCHLICKFKYILDFVPFNNANQCCSREFLKFPTSVLF